MSMVKKQPRRWATKTRRKSEMKREMADLRERGGGEGGREEVAR